MLLASQAEDEDEDPGQCRQGQDFVAEAGASRKSVGPWELSVGT
jgi:hypothetical protein